MFYVPSENLARKELKKVNVISLLVGHLNIISNPMTPELYLLI